MKSTHLIDLESLFEVLFIVCLECGSLGLDFGLKEVGTAVEKRFEASLERSQELVVVP